MGLAETPARYCGNCGHELGPEDQFCQNCGTPVHQAATVPTPEADVPVPPPPQQAGGSEVPPQQAEGTQRSWPLQHPFLTGCLGLIGLLLLLLIVVIAAIAIGSSGGGDGDSGDGKSGGNDSAQKGEQHAAAPADEDTKTLEMNEVTMATDKNGKNPTKVYSPDDTFYCVGYLVNAPEDTTITTVWIASDVETIKADTKIKQFSAKGGSGLFRFNLSNDGPWPIGKYEVELYLNDAKKPTKTLAFEVR
jgi:hypothetical protein